MSAPGPRSEDRPLKLAEYNAFCRSLPHASHVVQWGGAHVWKVGGKVFAIAWHEESAAADGPLLVTFKCSPLSFDMLREMPGLRPAPYLASRGLTWIQRTSPATLDDAGLCAYLAQSHQIVAAGLPRRMRTALGLAAAMAAPERSRTTRTSTSRAGRGEPR